MPHDEPVVTEEHEALLHFLYMVPVGLAQTSVDGEVVMMNPRAAQLLMPLSNDGDVSNLFNVLDTVAPELRSLSSSFTGASGTVCEGLRVQLSSTDRGKPDPTILSLTLLKLDERRLMAVLNEVI